MIDNPAKPDHKLGKRESGSAILTVSEHIKQDNKNEEGFTFTLYISGECPCAGCVRCVQTAE